MHAYRNWRCHGSMGIKSDLECVTEHYIFKFQRVYVCAQVCFLFERGLCEAFPGHPGVTQIWSSQLSELRWSTYASFFISVRRGAERHGFPPTSVCCCYFYLSQKNPIKSPEKPLPLIEPCWVRIWWPKEAREGEELCWGQDIQRRQALEIPARSVPLLFH